MRIAPRADRQPASSRSSVAICACAVSSWWWAATLAALAVAGRAAAGAAAVLDGMLALEGLGRGDCGMRAALAGCGRSTTAIKLL